MSSDKTNPLNQILYGPPGTGKTYSTINKALEIIFEGADSEDEQRNKYDFSGKVEKYFSYKDAVLPSNNTRRKDLNTIFKHYTTLKQIEFITFHQSYGYEEFIEGIKADTSENGEITYEKEDGIFKNISDMAKLNYNNSKKDSKQFSKEKDLKKRIDEFLDACLEEKEEFEKARGGKFTIENFVKKNIIIDSEDSQRQIKLDIETLYKLLEKNIDFKNVTELREEVYGDGKPRQNPSYYFPIIKKFREIKSEEPKKIEVEKLKNYVLIIDEINRGNISKIFGELITLIEDNKRFGNDEAVEITLPYSKDKFSVPKNLYIIGTMNTADRSIALMDTALRRRFEFVEMMPDLKAVNDIKVGNIKIDELLKTINERIEYLYDRDHTIGHAYFMSLKNINTEKEKFEELDNIFRKKIIPLLQEYFYDDWGKIQIVLGDHNKQINEDTDKEYDKFIQSAKVVEKDILGFDYEDIEDRTKQYRVNPESFTKETYLRLCKKL